MKAIANYVSYLFQLFPVIICVPNHHCLQLTGLEELKNFTSTYFVEAFMECTVQGSHRSIEDVIHICIYKILPVQRERKNHVEEIKRKQHMSSFYQ